MQTSIAASIADDPQRRQLDHQCKVVLSHKAILARILKHTVSEVAGMDTEEIIAAIEGEPLLEETPVPDTSEKIAGSNTESVSLSEGSIYYDVRFYIVLDEEGRMKILFDMEAQKDYYPGYKIVTRGIVYCARMISAQIGQEFDLEHYDDLKKVYSIWICFNPPAYIGNAISRYTMGKEDLLPGIPDEKRAYDKLEIVQICLREDLDQKDDELIRMLNILFSSRKSKEEIKRELEEDYGITMDDGYGREIDTMCNLSYMFEERGMKRGMERGMKTGMERGMKTGLERGMKTGLERGIAEVAGNLILMGKDNAFIRKATALSEEAIERLREQVPTGQKR